MYIKQCIKWPHEYVLAGNNKDRVAYNHLNITQWMAGISRIMKEGKCNESKDCMLDYLIVLLDDANDFSWQSAKASHVVLLCCMEQGEISSWSETEKNRQRLIPRDIPLDTNRLLHTRKTKQKNARSISIQGHEKHVSCVL